MQHSIWSWSWFQTYFLRKGKLREKSEIFNICFLLLRRNMIMIFQNHEKNSLSKPNWNDFLYFAREVIRNWILRQQSVVKSFFHWEEEEYCFWNVICGWNNFVAKKQGFSLCWNGSIIIFIIVAVVVVIIIRRTCEARPKKVLYFVNCRLEQLT